MEPSSIDQSIAAGYAVLSDGERRPVRQAPLQAVVAPCATALVTRGRHQQREGAVEGVGEARC